MNRRHALASLASLAAASLLPAHAGATQSPTAGKLRIALVGLGGYARYALPRLLQARHATLAGLVSGDRAKAAAWAAEWGLPQVQSLGYADFDRLADRQDLDAVHLCLPVGMHAEFAERALRAGKHVLCEKPLAATSAQARALIALAKERGLTLMPAYRAWYSKPLQDCLARLRQLGPVTAIDAHKGFAMSLPAGNWRFDPALSGGGSLFDIGPYSLQLSRWAADAMPVRAQAHFVRDPGDPRFARVEQHAAWILEFANGAIATGSSSWRYHLQNHARFTTRQGWIHLDPATPGSGERARIALADPPRIEEPVWPPTDQLPAMYDDFAQAIRDGREPAVSPREGLADLLVIEAIDKAAEGGGAVAVADLD